VDPSGEARAALREQRYQIVNTLAHVPDAPGLYAVYGSREAGRDSSSRARVSSEVSTSGRPRTASSAET
jgi:hypothetical protein